MKLSKRIQNLSTSPIRKLTPYADAAKAAGKKVYHLNIGMLCLKFFYGFFPYRSGMAIRYSPVAVGADGNS